MNAYYAIGLEDPKLVLRAFNSSEERDAWIALGNEEKYTVPPRRVAVTPELEEGGELSFPYHIPGWHILSL